MYGMSRRILLSDVICSSPTIVLFDFSNALNFGLEVVIDISLGRTVTQSIV